MNSPASGNARLGEIPSDLVWDLDICNPSSVDDPLRLMDNVRAAGAPRIFYTPRNGGHWVFCDYEAVTAGYGDWELFSSWPASVPRIENLWRSLPQAVSPPEHEKYRLPLNRAFSPASIRGIEAGVRDYARELIEGLAPHGGCDFVSEFAFRFPPGVFMRMMGMDLSRLEEFVSWTKRFFQGSHDDTAAAMMLITEYLSDFIIDKEANPTDDLGSTIANLTDESGDLFSFEERLNMCTLLFMAGLDTVANSLASMWRQMAERPELRSRIAGMLDNPKDAVEELLRYHTIAALSRVVTRDAEFQGVQLKAGDIVLLSNLLANHDPKAFPDPLNVDLGRDARKHIAFGYGIHRCVGQFLAKTEVAIALQEWLPRIPDFSLADRPLPYTGQISGYSEVKLEWPINES